MGLRIHLLGDPDALCRLGRITGWLPAGATSPCSCQSCLPSSLSLWGGSLGEWLQNGPPRVIMGKLHVQSEPDVFNCEVNILLDKSHQIANF